MRHRYRHRLVFVAALAALAGLLLPGLALAQVATSAPPGIFDSIVGEVQAASSHWISIGAGRTGIGWRIFTGLATLELVWWGITNALRKNDLGEWFSSLFLKMLELSFFGFIVSTAPTWMPAAINAIRNVGAAFLYATPGATSIPSTEMTPSGIMTLADTLVAGLPHLIANSSSWTHLAQSFLASLALIVSTVLLYIGFALVALQLLMTLTEMYLVLGIGSITLGFLGSRWTVQFGERYISYAVSVGAKLITTYAIVGIMVSLASKDATWMHQAGAGSVGPTNLIELAANGLIGGVLALAIPSVAGSALGGGAALGLSHLTSAGGGIARAAGAAGLGAAAGVVGAVGAGKATGAALARLGALTSVSGSGSSRGGGAGSSVGGFKVGAGSIAATPPPPGGIGGAAGAGMGAGGKAAGAGVSAAGKAAGAAISAVPGLQPVGAAVSAASQAAGKGVEAAGKAAGKGVAAAGKAASAARGATGAATTGSGAGPAGGTPFSGPGKGGGDAPSTGSAPGTGGPDQLSAPGGSPGAGGTGDGEGGKKEPSAASKLLRQAQHHAGQAHRGLPHEGGVSAPGLRFGHSED